MTEQTSHNPQALPNPVFRDTALAEFERRAAELDPTIAEALKGLGNEAIEAYASVGLYHNTLGDFVPVIMEEGLHAGSALAIPDAVDVQFAEELFKSKGDPAASKNQFSIYIKGERGDRKPGVFFYGKTKGSHAQYNEGYGQPERMLIFAQEMGYIMAQTDGSYSEAERAKARGLFFKYADIVNGGKSGHVSVIAANPFSPSIFNERLARLPEVAIPNTETAILLLENLGVHEFEGIYIPDTVPPQDLVVMDVELPIQAKLEEANIDPSRSRFFYTPSYLQRTQ